MHVERFAIWDPERDAPGISVLRAPVIQKQSKAGIALLPQLLTSLTHNTCNAPVRSIGARDIQETECRSDAGQVEV